jgi:hypothetical protein
MTIPAELLQRLAAAKSVTVLTGAGQVGEHGMVIYSDNPCSSARRNCRVWN